VGYQQGYHGLDIYHGDEVSSFPAARQFGPGFWTDPVVVGVWMLLVAALMISRLRTLSMKTVRVPAEFIAPLLVLVGLAGAAIITVPFLALALAVLIYLGHLPYAVYRYRWLGRHPEAWYVAARQRRAAVRALRTTRPGLRPPLRGRVAGAARARAAALNNRRRREDSTATNGQLSGPGGVSGGGVPGATGVTGGVAGPADNLPRRSGRRLGLRKIRRPR